MDLLDELQSHLLPGDGAMGTYLMELGAPMERCFEEFCVSNPDLVRRVHQEYIDAGARVIETNSFGANAVRLARHGLERRVNELNWAAAQLARECAKGRQVYVAGSVGPLGITAEQARQNGIDRQAAFTEQIGALLDGGCQLIFLETFLDLEELSLALYVKQSLHHCPVICSLACAGDGRLPDGTPLGEALTKLQELGADIVGVNCANGPQSMIRLFQQLSFGEGEFLSAFPNAGYPKYHEGRFQYFTTPEYFAQASVELAGLGARLLGGCCGTGPAHIAALAMAIRELRPVAKPAAMPSRAAITSVVERSEPATSPVQKQSILDLAKAGHTVVVTELDPPKTLDLDRFYTGAQALTAAGSDAITLADNSLAILRVSNLAVGAILEQRFNITTLLHLSCRDRNVIGLQSELLGMTALGIRHVLPLTGDPAKVGDHPGAASVYDVTSIELIRIIAQLNSGLNANGRDLKRSADLVIGCTYNPNARNADAQLARLERKLAAGAQYVMTQPVFDSKVVDEFHKRVAPFGVPILTGVWPLLNGRQAEFLHNEVPGISIPDTAREAMRGLEGAEGRAAGLAIAKDVCQAALERFNAVYLITPFLNYDTTVELAQYVRSQTATRP